MSAHFLEKLFEHNNWANTQIIRACASLTDAQLDAQPQSATNGSLRATLFHLVTGQQGYLRLFALPVEERLERPAPPPFAGLEGLARASGEGLLALVSDESSLAGKGRLHTTDGYLVEPWVLAVQVINHATEHREQIKSMLTALGVTPPETDGWTYGQATNALMRIEKENKG